MAVTIHLLIAAPTQVYQTRLQWKSFLLSHPELVEGFWVNYRRFDKLSVTIDGTSVTKKIATKSGVTVTNVTPPLLSKK